jgi:hypothetical protein
VISLSESSQGEVGDNREKWETTERSGETSGRKVVGALDNYSLVFVIFINFFGQLKD